MTIHAINRSQQNNTSSVTCLSEGFIDFTSKVTLLTTKSLTQQKSPMLNITVEILQQSYNATHYFTIHQQDGVD